MTDGRRNANSDLTFDATGTRLIDAAQTDILACTSDTTVRDAALRMQQHYCSSVIVTGHRDNPTGIWTEQDVLALDLSHPAVWAEPLSEIMSSPVMTLPVTASAADARALMAAVGIRHVVVLDNDDRPYGVFPGANPVTINAGDASLSPGMVNSVLPARQLFLHADTLLSGAARALADKGVSAAVVSFGNNNTPGLITARDVIDQLASEPHDYPLSHIARRPLITINADQTLFRARKMMIDHRIRHLGVAEPENGDIIGVLGFPELLHAADYVPPDGLLTPMHPARSQPCDPLAHRESNRASNEVRQYYEQMFHKNTAPKLLIDPETGYVADANPAALTFYGYSENEIRQQRIQDINQLSEKAVRAEWEKARQEKRRYFEFRHRLANGEVRDVQVYSGPVEMNGKTFLHSIIHDVTRLHQTEQEYRLLAAAFQTGQALMICDAVGNIERVNAAFTATTGYEPSDVLGRNPRMLSSGTQNRDFFRDLWQQVVAHGHWGGEIWNRRKNGEIYPQWEAITAVYGVDGDIEHYVAVFHEISEQKRLEDELERLATHDRLTGIFNRAKLYRLLDYAREDCRRYEHPFSVIMFDIDHFKAVNDLHGHGVGDNVLVELTSRVTLALRETDSFGRWGGEEFLILASNTDKSAALTLAERIRTVVAGSQFKTAGPVTISLGVAQGRTGESSELLEERVDRALYKAKHLGRDQVVCY